MTGLVHRLAFTVEFGMLLYDGTIDPLLALTAIGGSPTPVCAGNYLEQKATGECPQLIQVPSMIENAAAIDAAFPMTELGGSTPTDRALNTAVDQLIAMQPMGADIDIKPQYILLATDGQPNDVCVGGLGGDGSPQKAAVLEAVDRAAQRSIKTWVISLAGGDPGLQAHLDEVARHGDPNNPMAQTYTPTTPEDLVSALSALVGGAIGCEITLEGKVQVGEECRGRVVSNLQDLPCCQEGPSGMTCGGNPVATADGWRLTAPSTIELVGQACTNFLSGRDVNISAEFPCEIYLE
jgi:hypothetical protein